MKAARILKGKDPAAEYDIDDHLAALGARVAPLATDFQALMSSSLKASRALYPDQPEVDSCRGITSANPRVEYPRLIERKKMARW